MLGKEATFANRVEKVFRPESDGKLMNSNLNKAFSETAFDVSQYEDFIVDAHIGMDSTGRALFYEVIEPPAFGRQEGLASVTEQEKFWHYFEQFSHYRHLRLCTMPPGQCKVCDEAFVSLVENAIEKDMARFEGLHLNVRVFPC